MSSPLGSVRCSRSCCDATGLVTATTHPSALHTTNNSQNTSPLQRMSALYQYHNAPEVAPAHGLEYDDAVYPSSDKYPVIRELQYSPKDGKYGFEGDNRPPRIIFGMKISTFCIVAAIMLCVLVGAAVGGGVGGASVRNSEPSTNASPANATSTSPSSDTTALPTSIYSAAVPTYTPLVDCPGSNNTRYISSFASGTSGSVAPGTGLTYTKYCDKADPLSLTGSARIAEAYVYSFSDCIEVCAGYNFWNTNANCTAAVYQPGGSRPGNCWVGTTSSSIKASSLGQMQGTDVALLVPQ